MKGPLGHIPQIFLSISLSDVATNSHGCSFLAVAASLPASIIFSIRSFLTSLAEYSLTLFLFFTTSKKSILIPSTGSRERFKTVPYTVLCFIKIRRKTPYLPCLFYIRRHKQFGKYGFIVP